MNIKIVFGSTSLKPELATGWGLSYLINDKILFDTGGDPDMLFNNIEKMDIKISDLEAIIISHDHRDHTNGLWPILDKNSKVNIYGCFEFSREFKNKMHSYPNRLIETGHFTEIIKNIFLTGSIQGKHNLKKIYEQSLVLKTEKGVTVITGCAHPGITEIMEIVKKNFSEGIYLVMGGFHLKNKSKEEIDKIIQKFQQHNIKFVAPCHCTGETAVNTFKTYYKKNFIEIEIGKIIEV